MLARRESAVSRRGGARAPLLALLLGIGTLRGDTPPGTFRPLAIPGKDFELRPESERPFESLVIGLLPQGSEMLAIPESKAESRQKDRRAIRLRQELNAINVEVDHGRLLAVAPGHTRVFVAVPDPREIPEATGHEEEDFRYYLSRRAGWSESEIARRVRFFRVPFAILFPRDLSEILGVDARRRLVLGLGRDTDPIYGRAVERLVSVFPESFRLVRLRGVGVRDVNTEGGDLALVWTPEGRVGLLIGRHRVLRYLERHYGEDLTGRPVSRAQIEEAREAFRTAFFGVEVIVVGEEALEKPELASEELFHADMVVSVVRGRGRALAFVPTFGPNPSDAVSRAPLSPALVARVQTEYDLVAAQMARRGYGVVRLPFVDHPVRSPVNATPFVDPVSGQNWVLLGRYPEHAVGTSGAEVPLVPVQEALDQLSETVLRWRRSRSEEAGRQVDDALERVWKEWDRSLAAPNPIFEMQKRLFEENGIRVRSVPLIPSGEGGIHCLLLR